MPMSSIVLSELNNLFLTSVSTDCGNDALQDSLSDSDGCTRECYTCSIVYDKDVDFGDLHLVEPTGSEEPVASHCYLYSTSIQLRIPWGKGSSNHLMS